jgi:POT family proton-dependent oligopeptide transporter
MLDLTRRIGRAYGVRLPLRRQLIIGLVLASGAFGLLVLASALNGEAKLGLGWLLGALCLLSAAELLVIPGAMALVAELFSQQYGALSQGLLFGAQALGYLCSGILASQWGRLPEFWFFVVVGAVGMVGATILWAEQRCAVVVN